MTPELQAILDALPYYVMLVDDHHRIVLANDAVQRDLGRSPEELLGCHCPEVVHGTCGPFEGCPLERARETGDVVEAEYQEELTGKVMWSGIYPTRYQSPEGSRIYLHTARDVTVRHDAEQRLLRSHEAQCVISDVLRIALQPSEIDEVLQRVLDRLLDLPWLAQRRRGGIYLSEPADDRLVLRAHSGLSPEAAEALHVLEPGRGTCGQAALTQQVVVGHDDAPLERTEIPLAVGNCCVPILRGERVLGVIGVFLDGAPASDSSEAQLLRSVADVVAGVVERKRAEWLQREHERVAMARERMARVGALSAGLAHTVRNPLHGVMSCLEILESQAQRGQVAADEIIGLMRDGLLRIERTTRRLLGLTREAKLERKPVRVDVLLQDVVDIMRLQARDHAVALELGETVAAEALVDPDAVVEALTAVVTNAIQACESGGKVLVRSRSAREQATTLELEVEDDGVGIEQENLPRVTEPFFTTRPVTEGSGLGLAIVRRIVDEHQGEVTIQSEPGRGTLVRLGFPDALGQLGAEPANHS